MVTTVHWPDDTRIRERLVRVLASDFEVRYATRSPGPTDRTGLEHVELRGGRLRRNLSALLLSLRGGWDLLVLHDPETLPAGLLARMVRRRPVVFDVHEDVPAIARTRAWVRPWLRGSLAWASRLGLYLAERMLTLTLAEEGYARLFRDYHPVFPNYPDTAGYPDPVESGDGTAVYVGDVTMARGVDVAVEACIWAGVPLRVIGRVTGYFREELSARSEGSDGLVFEGVLPNPRALESVARASVGLAPLRDLPNYRHSQPTKILEYLALGVPVVASDLPGTRALVEGLQAVFLVAPDDPAGLAEAMRNAMAPEVRELAREQAPRIRERFRWPEDEVRAFYRSLVESLP